MFAPKPTAPTAIQKTLSEEAPLAKRTVAPATEFNAPVILKRNIASGSPCASKVNVPVMATAAAIP